MQNLISNPLSRTLTPFLFETLPTPKNFASEDFLIDSMPVVLSRVGTRRKRGRLALEIAKTGFCETKETNFHGVRLHLIANRRSGKLSAPAHPWLKEGNGHDLTALREIADELPAVINLFGDKAYADQSFKAALKNKRITLLIPAKKPKKAALSQAQKHFNKIVLSFRQSIQSLFK